MRVSIIIPALNEAAGIALAVQRAWAAGPSEVIVVDGGSTDGTLEIARHCDCLALASLRGRAVQQNHGAAHAHGDVVLFLHADNHLEPTALQGVERALRDDGVVGGSFRQQIESPRRIFRLLERGNDWRARWGRPYGDQGIFVRREVFLGCGGFPEVPLLEDVLLAGALRRKGKLVLLPERIFVSPRRWEKHGVLRQTLRNWLLLGAFALGASPQRLARFYVPHGSA